MSGVEIIERPRTSRGRRIHHEQDTSAAEIERPGTRRGHRSNTPVEGTERPLTRHGRRGSVPERPITRHGRQSQQDFHEGSKTRTKSDSDYINQEYREGSTSRIDILTLDGGPTPTPPPKPNVRMRPKSAKGRVRPKPAPRPSIDRGRVFCSQTCHQANVCSPFAYNFFQFLYINISCCQLVSYMVD